jgi:hypothetical protein
VRQLIVARPYNESGAKSNRWEALALAPSGDITANNRFFDMGRATSGNIAFTPDGEIGLVAQEDGSVGVFRVLASGDIEVLHAAFKEGFYASEVFMGPEGDRAFVMDGNWRENGGGIYTLKIGCDDSIKSEGLLVPAKLPKQPLWRENGDLLVLAHDFGNSAADQDLHLLSASDITSPTSSTTVFPDRDAIVASAAVTADQNFVLVGDNSGFSPVPNRVAVARLNDQSVESVQLLSPIEDPFAIATSPFDDAALVVSGFGDALLVLDYDPSALDSPFSISGPLAYLGGKPQLPGSLVMIDRGDLRGTILIAENGGVRRVAFEGGGIVSDKGRTDIGSSFLGIVGAIGVQP